MRGGCFHGPAHSSPLGPARPLGFGASFLRRLIIRRRVRREVADIEHRPIYPPFIEFSHYASQFWRRTMAEYRRSKGRRSGKDRRSGVDTRTEEEKKLVGERRSAIDLRSGVDRRSNVKSA